MNNNQSNAFKNHVTNGGRKASVKIDKQADTYKFSLIIDKSHVEDKEMEDIAKEMSKELSEDVFNSNKVDINLCNDAFKPLKTISR